MRTKYVLFIVFVLVVAASGCDRAQTESQPATPSGGGGAAAEGAKFLLDDEPAGAVAVIKVRETAKDGDDVVIVGRIGGREDPWINNRAAFLIVDPSLKSCHDTGCLDCEKPWDYC